MGADILASPVALRGRVNGRPLAWKIRSWKLDSSAKDKAVYSGVATADGFKMRVKTTIEFDGMMRFDWRLEPKGGRCEVRDLAFVIPVKRSVARSFTQWPLQRYSFNDQSTWNKSGDVTDAGWHCEFTSFFWLGDQSRGIQWFAEHRAGWMPADEKKIIEVKRGPESADLILHLADGKHILDKPLNFTFGLMASPVKPRLSACDMSGARIAMFGARWNITPSTSQQSSITIPRSLKDMSDECCIEMDFRPDWDPGNPTEKEKAVELCGRNCLEVQWVADKRALPAHS